MKERPILFSAPMVRAILEGRKTQTRRVMNEQPVEGSRFDSIEEGRLFLFAKGCFYEKVPCPYGQPDDHLWVRETLQTGARNNPAPSLNHCWRYAADNQPVMVDPCNKTAMLVWAHHKDGETCVSIHMPRWASRIQLEITDVRVQRVQDISAKDCAAEGSQYPVTTKDCPRGKCAPLLVISGDFPASRYLDKKEKDVNRAYSRAYFASLWDSINAKRGFGWDKNPWVWALTFRGLA